MTVLLRVLFVGGIGSYFAWIGTQADTILSFISRFPEQFAFAFLGGFLPALIWLYFLLREDDRCPEPGWMIFLAFAVGGAAVPLAFYPEIFACMHLAFEPIPACHALATIENAYQKIGLRPIVALATIEEVLKYSMAAIFILWRRAVDEKPDYLIYMVTVGLGFAAVESFLFVFNLAVTSYNHQDVPATAQIAAISRFIGPALVHVACSGLVGLSLAVSMRWSAPLRTIASGVGLILAVGLHTAFNAIMIFQDRDNSTVFYAFFLIWLAVVFLLAVFEVLKYFQYQTPKTN